MSKSDTKTSDSNIDELVNKHLSNLDDKGKLQLPDDMPEWQKRVIRAEKRQRDAQSALSKARAELEEKKAIEEVLRKKAIAAATFNLSDDERAALDTLKSEDPDAYRIRMNELEKKAIEEAQRSLEEEEKKAREEAQNRFVADNRLAVLEAFRQANPSLQLTDEVLANDVPPRFMNELNAGKYDYQTYLTKVVEYLKTTKVLPNQDPGETKSLGDITGGSTPGKDAANKQGAIDYAKLTF